ncbi:Cna B-type domain-containing protein [Enterococcus gilvus]|uniref:LPXTG-domain-containing protein cell wall anchor domain n=1 Tax=Enterococcus gilvus ATCC BAA-350 TaxID=1158614 RepID=R2XFG7_9ENTE|nr:Cna B-type domain-containing protein [Enterococcus gilvus]EOI53559.1 LPXTG-domain-containing protein cell wall anchor domain [Enterococcus gilvus ATCC BAA-350]EOW81166.1 hypothetical protein I592_00451 [Enterococcus gilvus ATCC BAA-350]OJG42876.1 LPXTG-domain-containing protein cell wall anchor domain [Enterococcus gilvus]
MKNSNFLLKKKIRYTSNLLLTLVLLGGCLVNLLSAVTVKATGVYNGDQYVTETKLEKKDGEPIVNGGSMSIAQNYYLTYEWEVPDNTFYQGDTLLFSIPKEFKIINQFTFPLVDPEGEEVALAKVMGNDTEGYRIEMTFTTDYIETHSDVSGSFRMEYTLNQKYVKGDETITLPLPDGNITIDVPHYDEPGGGGGIGAGDSQKLTKQGTVKNGIKYNPETGKYDLPQRYIEWEINLGLGKLTDSIGKDNFDQVDRIVIEDTPKDQKIVSMSLYQESWADDDWGWRKAFFKDIPFDYGTIKESDVALKKDPTNSYVQSFSYNVWPYIQQQLKEAINEETVLNEVAIDYYAEPLEFLTETTTLTNDATVKIYYKDGSEGEKWTLSESVEWNVADGEINGKVSDVAFKKIDGNTQAPLPGAKFDLYKKGIDGKYALKKSGITSDEQGIVHANKLTTGDYYFIETQSPAGYPDPEDPRVLDFTVETKDLGGSQNIKDLGEVKNYQENTKIDLSVEKKWEDGNNQDGIRPQSIKVQLYGDNRPIGDNVSLDENNHWRHTWEELEEKDNGTVIQYEVKETSTVPRYETSVTGNGTNTITITNKHTPEVTEVRGEKTWVDDDNHQNSRPNEVTIELYGNGTLRDTKKTNKQNNWQYEFINLPKNENGKTIVYTVKEQPVENYHPEYNGFDIVNTYQPGRTNISVKKKWEDKNNQDGIRPNAIQVQLKGDGKAIGAPVTLDQQNDWYHTWEDLEKAENGKVITYTVEEVSDSGKYKVEVSEEKEYQFTLTNHYTPEVIDIKGKKNWQDNQNEQGNRPKKITVELYGNGELIDTKKTTAKDDWSYSFINLPKNSQGSPINYEVKEQSVLDYEASYSGHDITNTYRPELTKVSVKKEWDDKNDQDGIRPDTIQVQLKGNGKPIGDAVLLNEKGDWSHTWEDLEKRKDGENIDYTVEEVSDSGKYKVEMTKEGDYHLVLTNHYKPEEVDVKGTKKWEDNQNEQGNRPSAITVELYGDGKLIDTQKTTAANNWTYHFTGLPKNNQGIPIHYEVKEQYVEDYQPSYSGFDITNTYHPELVSVSVKKEWNDKDDQDGIRPSTIQVQLKGNGQPIGAPVDLDEKSGWSHTWEELEKRENGKKINYTVEEVGDLGKYTVDMVKENDYQILLTNSYRPEEIAIHGKKMWDDNQDEKGNRPAKITVELYGNGALVATQDTTAASNWAYSFTNLPKNNQGKAIDYEVKEQDVEDYEASYSGFDITNTYHPVLAKVTVKKEWDDKGNQDGIQPQSINVQLKGNGKSIGDPVTLDEKGDWSHTWENLEKRENGKKIDYTVEEVSDPGKYTVETVKENEYRIVLTNHYTPEEIDIHGNKRWQDNDDQDGMRPNEIQIHLIANNRPDPVDTQIVKPDANGHWSYTFTGLPKKENGKDIDYSIKEEAVSEYEFSSEKTEDPTVINLTNTHKVRKTQVEVKKSWDDKDDQDGIRPHAIQVQLLADGERCGEPVELSDANQWKHSWTDLDERKGGKVIEYKVEEVTIDSEYASTINQIDKEHIEVVNTHKPEETEIYGTKSWDDSDDKEGQRPEKIVVRLFGDGQEVAKKTVTAEDNWNYHFTHLPKNNKGKEIVYTVAEDRIVDYTAEIHGTDIINKYTPGVTSIQVTKKWEDENNQDGIRPNQVLVQLFADGLPVGEPVGLNETNQWTHQWENLVARAYGKEINYSVKEIDVPKDYVAETKEIDKEHIVLTNHHVPEKVKITGSKHWEDDNNKYKERPDSITVNLFADGKKVATKEVKESDHWNYEFSDLPKFEKGKEILYTVSENEVKNYTSRIDGFTITNTYTPKERIPSPPKEDTPTKKLPNTSENQQPIPHSKTTANSESTKGLLPKTGSKALGYLSWLGIVLLLLLLVSYRYTRRQR